MKIQTDYNHQQIESKWQKIWDKNTVYKLDLSKSQNPYYNLMMWPYPSAEGLHIGNVYAFVGSDIHGRFQRMQGKDVFEPIGFDSGGIHSENFAIKMGVHPKKMTEKNITNFTRQLKQIGNMFNWEQDTHAMDPDYYHWTQWIFTQLFKAGLAYKKNSPVTWCPSCKTTVSDEQTESKVKSQKSKVKTEDGKIIETETQVEITVCERCKTPIERKNMSQWFFKITDYAEKLLDNTQKLNWPQKVLTTQQNWIGKSEGAEVIFKTETGEIIKVFTTRPDTLYGCTFMCLAPEHPLVLKITTKNYKDKVLDYIKLSKSKTEQERKIGDKNKTGVFTGAYAINPINNRKVPIWVADYVLMGYGEGAIMAVPAHDERDFDFAKKYDLEIIPVIKPYDNQIAAQVIKKEIVYIGEGKLMNSGEFDSLNYEEAKTKIVNKLEQMDKAKFKTIYKLRDWCISRQRYWGPPIPMIYCSKCAQEGKSWFTSKEAQQCSNAIVKKAVDENKDNKDLFGWYPAIDKDLPVILPDIEDYLPDGSGKAPLSRYPEFYKTVCPYCGGEAVRETDVSDTFLDSSWYFLRYPTVNIDTKNDKKVAFDTDMTKKWLPVTQYCGGAEHAVLHLMYSRFLTMALYDLDHLDFEEPFPNFYAHGMIIKDGAKMSKSRGNVVNPDDYVNRFGADTIRLYLSFMGPYSEGGDFRDTGIFGMKKFVNRFYRSILSWQDLRINDEKILIKIENIVHRTIKKVEDGIERFKYNTSIAAIMECINEIEELLANIPDKSNTNGKNFNQALTNIILLISPFAPHISEELWQMFNKSDKFVSVHNQPWPKYDKNKTSLELVTIAIQINGKLRGVLEVNSQTSQDKDIILTMAKQESTIASYLAKGELVREIFIPGEVVNFVVK